MNDARQNTTDKDGQDSVSLVVKLNKLLIWKLTNKTRVESSSFSTVHLIPMRSVYLYL